MADTTKHLPALLAHVWDNAGLQLLGNDAMPRRVANRNPPSPERVLIVLLYMTSMTRLGNGSRGMLAYSADTIGRDTGLQRAAVQDALYALEQLGLIMPTGGGKGRAKRFLVLPDVVTETRVRESVVESVPESQVESVPESVPESVVESVVESIWTHYGDRDRDTGRDSAPASTPPACPTHPTGYRHNQPCRTCADLRRWEQGRPTAVPPSWSQQLEAMANPCAHGTPGGGPRNCPLCRVPQLTAVGVLP